MPKLLICLPFELTPIGLPRKLDNILAEEEEEEEVYKLGLCATLLAPSSIDAWRTIWGVGVQPSPNLAL